MILSHRAMGLSVHGTVNRDLVLRKGPVRHGEVLILTKPLGTGILMAADMRGKQKIPIVRRVFSNIKTFLIQSSLHGLTG